MSRPVAFAPAMPAPPPAVPGRASAPTPGGQSFGSALDAARPPAQQGGRAANAAAHGKSGAIDRNPQDAAGEAASRSEDAVTIADADELAAACETANETAATDDETSDEEIAGDAPLAFPWFARLDLLAQKPIPAGAGHNASAGDEPAADKGSTAAEAAAPSMEGDQPGAALDRLVDQLLGRGGDSEGKPADKPDRKAAPTARDTAESKKDDAAVARLARVVEQQNAPAPTPQSPAATATLLAASIAEAAPQPAAIEAPRPIAAAVVAHSGAGAIQSLKIQLHPAELGMVTAKLRMTNDQLSVEIEVEDARTHRLLSDDSESIVKALQASGVAVETVTVRRVDTAGAPAGEAGAGFQDAGDARPGARNGQEEQRSSGGRHGENRTVESAARQPELRAARGGVYI